MLKIFDAISIILKDKKATINDITAIMETPTHFIIALNNDDEGYEAVNKNDKSHTFMWIWEYADEIDAKRVKELDINTIKREAV